jgi:DNA-binding SARP family transcriptional activator
MADFAGKTAPVLGAKIRAPRPAGLQRGRLDAALARLDECRLGLVVAPAGSGKTTLLAQVAAASAPPAAWFRAETSDGDPATLLRGLHAALHAVLPGLAGDWADGEAAAAALEAMPSPRVLLVIDDLHTLAGTPAETVLERFLECSPAGLRLLAGSRLPPGFNLSRLRVAGSLLELSGEHLRFRTWEVERLFADVYHEPLRPDDLAELSRRTEGWAAALYLFHLATRDRPSHERHRTLSQIGSRSRLVGEYLARNVVGGLPAELGTFLVETSVLGCLSSPLCDAFLGTSGSRALLEALAGRQILSHSSGSHHADHAEDTYRCHEVLRSHLEAALVERIGEAEARGRYRRAAVLLEGAQALPEALYAWSRAEDWEEMARLLGRDGDQISGDPGAWLDLLPSALRAHDPWLLLATARQHRAAGRWRTAMEHYRRAETAFGERAPSGRCHRERQALACWLDGDHVPAGEWFAPLLGAVRRNPSEAGEVSLAGAGVHAAFAGGLALLLAGHLREARTQLISVAEASAASAVLASGARLAGAVAGLLAGDPAAAAEAGSVAEDAEKLGIPWLSRMSRAALALSDRPDGLSEAAGARLAFDRMDDPWGSGLAAVLEGLGALRLGQSRDDLLAGAAARFKALGASCLEAWCSGARALAGSQTGHPEALDLARRAEMTARSLGLLVPLAHAYDALAILQPARAGELRALAVATADEAGLATGVPCVVSIPSRSRGKVAEPVVLQFFGGFRLTVNGRRRELTGLKPRARELFRLLASQAGRPLHREVLLESLWPDTSPESGMRNLQVGVSSLRQCLQRALGPPKQLKNQPAIGIERDGDAYRLAFSPEVAFDLLEFEQALRSGKAAQVAGDVRAAVASLECALEMYGGDLLPEDGPAEWVVTRRERCRGEAAGAARALAELLLDTDEPAGAARVCQRGLEIDPYQDALWRMLIAAHERVPNPLAAARARGGYEEVLEGLGCLGL